MFLPRGVMIGFLILVICLIQQGATTDISAEHSTAMVDNDCDRNCANETKENMYMLRMCVAGASEGSTAPADMSNIEYDAMMASMNSSCLMDDICCTLNQAVHIRKQCEQEPTSLNRSRRKRAIFPYAYLIPTARWDPDSTVNYVISTSFTLSHRQMIVDAINLYRDMTCLTFTEGAAANYINIVTGGGCSSFLGRIGGPQALTLNQPGCFERGIVEHEFAHALGVLHEQSRTDRDNYVRIFENNIASSFLSNFLITEYAYHETAYDFGSVMQYEPFAFSSNGQNTLESIDSIFMKSLGQRGSITHYDMYLINELYCPADVRCPSATLVCEHEGYLNTKTCTSCNCPPIYTGLTCADLPPLDAMCGAAPQEITLATGGSRMIDVTYTETDMICVWKIKVPDGESVLVNTNAMDIPSTRPTICRAHWLELYPSGCEPDNLIVQRYCGTGTANGPNDLVVDCSEILIAFTVNINPFLNDGGSFMLTVSAVSDLCLSNTCDPNAQCVPTVSSFTCTCNEGYAGTGATCSDINECNTGSPCTGDNEMCMNTIGSFFCGCAPGFCREVGECKSCAVTQPTDTSLMTSMVSTFNDVRSKRGGSDINKLTWNDELADSLEIFNSACDGNFIRSDTVGIVLIQTTSTANAPITAFDPPSLIQSYEDVVFNYAANDCDLPTSTGRCNNFRRVVWRAFTDFACATQLCGSTTELYLRYATGPGTLMQLVCAFTPDIFQDDVQPFNQGAPCSECHIGRDGCCDGLCVLQNQIETSTTDMSTSTSDPPTSTTDMPTVGTDPPTAGTDPPTAGTDPPTVGTDPPTAGTDPPTVGTDPPTAGTDPPTVGTDPPTAGTDPPTVGTDPPTAGTDPPTVGTDPPTVGTDPPTAGTDPPTAGTDPPTAGTDPPTVGTDPPTAGTDPPTVSTDPPTAGTDPPTVGTDPPTAGTDPPTVGTDPPTVGTDPPTVGTDPPMSSSEMPTVNTDPPMSTSDAPTMNTDPPTSTTDKPTSTTEMPSSTEIPSIPITTSAMSSDPNAFIQLIGTNSGDAAQSTDALRASITSAVNAYCLNNQAECCMDPLAENNEGAFITEEDVQAIVIGQNSTTITTQITVTGAADNALCQGSSSDGGFPLSGELLVMILSDAAGLINSAQQACCDLSTALITTIQPTTTETILAASPAMIIGLVLGSTCALAFLVAIIVLICCRRRPIILPTRMPFNAIRRNNRRPRNVRPPRLILRTRRLPNPFQPYGRAFYGP